MYSRGVGIVTYNRAKRLGDIIESVIQTLPEDVLLVVADDGSTDETPGVVASFSGVHYVRGPNRGVAHNKNRALCVMRDCTYMCLLEDDLMPRETGWFELYERAAEQMGVHHFCRVQEEVEGECEYGLPFTPICGVKARGDLTFITRRVIATVGGLHPGFRGAGYAHVEWQNRIADAGLIDHPWKWIDIQEARDKLVQVGDTEGGRWNEDPAKIKQQLKDNRAVQRRLKAQGTTYVPLRWT